MNIQILGDNISLSSKVKKLIDAKINLKLEKLLTDFAPDLKIASMRVTKDKIGHFTVNFDMNLPKKEYLFASTSHVNLESALIDLSEQIEKQIKRYKQTLVNYSLS